MTTLKMTTWFLAALIGLCSSQTGSAKEERYKYSELQIKDYDEMDQMVRQRLKKVRALSHPANSESDNQETRGDREAIDILRDTLKLIMSRPDADNMVSKLITEVRKELSTRSAYEDTLASLIGEAIGTIENKPLPAVYKATSLFVLENIMGEIRPGANERQELRKLLERIRDAKIQIPEDVKKDRKIRSMHKTQNPSEKAAAILKKLPPLKPAAVSE